MTLENEGQKNTAGNNTQVQNRVIAIGHKSIF